ncbi:MAG: DMT family transporter [Pirellulaceae bacterium]|nr:DMT family transporter [Pirellulaceae bacterium]
MSRSTANVLLLLAGAIWGMGFIAQQTAMEDMPAMLFIALRFLLAAAVVAPLSLWELRHQIEPFSPQTFGRFSILGGVFFIAMTLQQLGLLGTTVTNAGFLTALYVVMVPIVLFVVLRQRQPIVIWIAAAISLTGIFLLSGGSLARITWGDWFVVLCAFFWAIHVILVGKFVSETTLPITMAATQFLLCGLFALLAHVGCAIADVVDWAISPAVLVAASPEILYAGVMSGGVAFTLQVVAQRRTSPSIAAILMGSESLFAALFGAILLGERLRPLGYVGCVLIFSAVLAVELLPTKPRRNKCGEIDVVGSPSDPDSI